MVVIRQVITRLSIRRMREALRFLLRVGGGGGGGGWGGRGGASLLEANEEEPLEGVSHFQDWIDYNGVAFSDKVTRMG